MRPFWRMRLVVFGRYFCVGCFESQLFDLRAKYPTERAHDVAFIK